MQQNSFNPHARILHNGQYEIKQNLIEVPIKLFDETPIVEKNVQDRIESLRLEIEELEEQIKEKRRINQEKADQILTQVQDEAKRVLEEAEQHAFNRIQKSVQEKESVLLQTTEEAEKIRAQAEKNAQEIHSNAEKESEKLKDIAQKDGFDQGHLKGIDSGKQEVNFAVERLHGIIAETARERERILIHSETQVINLVLTMVKKVVKKLTLEHQDVVIENIKAALELLRGAMTIFIKVSPHDYNYAASFKEDLVRSIESRADLKFIEDPTIEPGGVYIETDTGDIDSTIRSQLEELENQMRFYMPVKIKSPEIKRREQEESKIIEQEKEKYQKQEERKGLSKTDFAQREEYSSNIETIPSDLISDIDSTDSVFEENSSQIIPDSVDQDIVENTIEMNNLNDVDIQDINAEIIDESELPHVDPNNVFETYSENNPKTENINDHNDDIIV